LLYIAGCVNRCTALDRYAARQAPVTIWTPEQTEEAIRALEAFLAQQ
jgi:hypothetical protein